MKYILAATMMLSVAVSANAAPMDAERSILVNQSIHMTHALAPTVDPSQSPVPLPPPIVAGTVPEDRSIEQQRQVQSPTASKNKRKNKRSLFDKLFKR